MTEIRWASVDFHTNWLAEHWKLVAIGTTLGLLAALAAHTLILKPTYSIRVDLVITDSPLGSPAFVRELSRQVIDSQLGARARVSVYQNGTVSIARSGLTSDIAEERYSEVQNAVTTLQATLDEKLAELYGIVQQDLNALPNNTAAYEAVTKLRPFVTAQEAGLYEQVRVQNSSVARASPSLPYVLGLGLISGLAFGVVAAAAASAVSKWSRRGNVASVRG